MAWLWVLQTLKSFVGWCFQIKQSPTLPRTLPLFQYWFAILSNQSEENYFLQIQPNWRPDLSSTVCYPVTSVTVLFLVAIVVPLYLKVFNDYMGAGYLPYNCSDLLLFISSQCFWSWISQRKNGDERILQSLYLIHSWPFKAVWCFQKAGVVTG